MDLEQKLFQINSICNEMRLAKYKPIIGEANWASHVERFTKVSNGSKNAQNIARQGGDVPTSDELDATIAELKITFDSIKKKHGEELKYSQYTNILSGLNDKAKKAVGHEDEVDGSNKWPDDLRIKKQTLEKALQAKENIPAIKEAKIDYDMSIRAYEKAKTQQQ